MIDSDIQKAIKISLDNGLLLYGITGITILQSYQKTMQGTLSTPAIYFTKIFSHRYGFQEKKYIYNSINQNYDKIESTCIEDTYQINATGTQNLNNTNSLNIYDIVEISSSILQSDETIDFLASQNIGIQRITDIRIVKFVNDYDNFRESPSFDVTVSYDRQLISTVPVATVSGNIQRV